jgi:hypothetical protein
MKVTYEVEVTCCKECPHFKEELVREPTYCFLQDTCSKIRRVITRPYNIHEDCVFKEERQDED